MTHAIRIHKTGGPEVLSWEEVQLGKPGPGEARIRHTAVGLNFVDVYNRMGLYPQPLPSGLGGEGAGVVEDIGPGVTEVKPGDRVAYTGGPLGAYSEARLIPAERLVLLPKGISDRQAAAMMLKGLTAQYLIRQTYRVKAGDTILFHAAAGGVGLIACQWAKHLGATVIGTVGNDEKAKLAKSHGCDHVIVYTREDFQKRVVEITSGNKVPVVYDSVGKDTFMKSLDCLAPLGLLAFFGQSSGPVEPFNLALLAQKGSLFITRPTLQTYGAKREAMVAMAKELFARPPARRCSRSRGLPTRGGTSMRGRHQPVPNRLVYDDRIEYAVDCLTRGRRTPAWQLRIRQFLSASLAAWARTINC